ncbi:hypothetical protein VPH35_123403 [Triticum aestivum]|uniref:Uncharacterized protein n=1 Tax=Triticum turgidum subsp. durum TaxID=4567 RepID=A0A9R1BNW8_TRITD|nr:unnamed protein product [Triticum turgidum subsp. durum]
MASGGGLMTKKELGETHDVLRFGVNNSVHGDLALAHPVQATIKEAKFWDKKKKFGTEAIYGSTFNIRRDLDTQILSRLTQAGYALMEENLLFLGAWKAVDNATTCDELCTQGKRHMTPNVQSLQVITCHFIFEKVQLNLII